MQNLRLMTALTAMVMTATALSACGGNECASGTTEKDGQCVPTSTLTCGDGTTLENGACVPTSTTTCGAGTILENGACVATSECGDGTMLVNGKCEPTSTITCGAGTMESNGACVPTSTLACGPGTMESGGNCVIAALACGTGAQLDANAGTCVVTDAVCGTGTAFTNGSCLPTDAVCAMGTTFNDATATCLPDATCRMGDVVLGGICVRPVDQLISEATVMETENNDPALGGTAQALTLPAAGTKLVVAGAIGAPTDLDADTIADQDSDAYTVTLAAGELIQLSVQPAAGPSLGFVVFGPDGSNYTRSSTLGLTPGAARQIFAPVAGDYTVVVEPAVTLAGNAGPIGNATWTYALTAEKLAAPTAVDVDASAMAITGEFANLNDNLFRATNLTAGGLAQLTVNSLGANVEGVYYVGDSLATMTRVFPAVVNGKQTLTLNAGEDLVFFDWIEVNGPDTSFSLNAAAPANLQALGALGATNTDSAPATIAGLDSYFYTFSAQAGQVLRISQNNAEAASLRISVTGVGVAAGLNNTLPVALSNTAVGSDPNYTFAILPATGNYIITVENTTATARTNVVLSTLGKIPQELGNKAGGDTITATTGAVTVKDREYARVTFTENVKVTGTVVAGSGDPDFRLYNATTGALIFSSTSGTSTETITERTVPAGTYLTEVYGFSALPNSTTTLNLVQGPISEIEPNNDAATATPIAQGRQGAGSFGNGDSDFFAITVPTALTANQALRVNLVPTASTGSTPVYTCTLRDAAGATVTTGTSINDCVLYGQALAAGTYSLELTNSSMTASNYTFTSAVINNFGGQELEPNNDAATANALTIGTTVYGDSSAGATVDSDFYSFTLANDQVAGELLVAQITALGGRNATSSFTVELRDAAGTLITSGASFNRGNLLAGAYTLTVKRNSSSTSSTGRYALTTLSGIAPTMAEFENTTSAPIVDNVPAGTNSTITVAKPGCTVTGVQVFMNVSHGYIGDVELKLTGPTGAVVMLHDNTGGSADDIIGVYPFTLSPAQSLAAFNGLDPNGVWTLNAADNSGGVAGTLNNWGLAFTCAP
jgi:subtilisin-like proprotein convertase family protein